MAQIAITLARSGDRSRSRQTFDRALAINEQADNDRRWVLEAIAVAMAQAGDYGRALEVAQTMESPTETLAGIATSLFGMGAINLAKIGQLTILPDFLEKTSLPHHCIIYTLQAWQQALVMYLDNAVPAIKRSLAIFPFDYLLAYHGVQMLQLAHWKQ